MRTIAQHAAPRAEWCVFALETDLLAMAHLLSGASATDAVVFAIKALEAAACTNAGIGSSLNENGEVEVC